MQPETNNTVPQSDSDRCMTDKSQPASRLRRCRRYAHGLSRSPVTKDPRPLGEKAILPCPRTGEGDCVYRRPYGCTDPIREIALSAYGCCAIEATHYDRLVEDLLRKLDYRDGEEPGEDVLDAVALLAEAMIYSSRALAHELRRMVGEVPTILRGNALRYQTAGVNAQSRRESTMLIARMRELHLDVDRIIADSGGYIRSWWRESCKARWIRDSYRIKDEPRERTMEERHPEYYAARAARMAEWDRLQRKVGASAAPRPAPPGGP